MRSLIRFVLSLTVGCLCVWLLSPGLPFLKGVVGIVPMQGGENIGVSILVGLLTLLVIVLVAGILFTVSFCVSLAMFRKFIPDKPTAPKPKPVLRDEFQYRDPLAGEPADDF